MTLASETNQSGPYACNGVTTEFAVDFRFLSNSHLTVYLTNVSTGASTTLVLDTDYTVTGAGDSEGEVTTLTAYSNAFEILIVRDVPYEQSLDLVNQTTSQPENLENAFDKVTMLCQQLKRTLDLCVKVSLTDDVDPDDYLEILEEYKNDTLEALTAALAAQTASEAALDEFTDIYLGGFTADPTVDNDGEALQAGAIYWHTTTATLRAYDGVNWQDTGTSIPATFTSDVFDGDASTVEFTLSVTPSSANAVAVFVAGVRLVPTTDYTVSGTTITFDSAPGSGTGNVFCLSTTPVSSGIPDDGSVTAAKLAADAVTEIKILDDAVTTDKLVDAAATYAKMQDVSATSRVLGRKTAGAGAIEETTLSEVLDFIGSAAQGDILYRGASTWARLGAGTSGHYLKTGGAAANPAWGALAIPAAAVDQTAIGNSAVGQGELKTATGSVSTSQVYNTYFGIDGDVLTLPGGTYGFYPQFHGSGSYAYRASMGGGGSNSSSYSTSLWLGTANASNAAYAQQRYIQSSPPYRIGGTTWGHFLFVLRNVSTGEIISSYEAEDPPWAYNGPEWNVKDSEDRIKCEPHPFPRYFGKDLTALGLEIALIDLSFTDMNLWKKEATQKKLTLLEDINSVVKPTGRTRSSRDYGIPQIEGFTDKVIIKTRF